MHEPSLTAIADQYFKRFGYLPQMIKQPPPQGMQVCIVIPCYDEPQVQLTLDALRSCKSPQYPVEVILVINTGAGEHEVQCHNRKVMEKIAVWRQRNATQWLHLHCIWVDNLPAKHAGVGLARKIGMDEALRRFAYLNISGMIACLDADCTVAPNYLRVLEQTQLQSAPASCTIHFEHQFEKVKDSELRAGIIHYELFLRYYVNALAYAKFPYCMHTVGSSMTVRADIYALSGGMNRRKAGEDFYFLHKVVPLGDFRNIGETKVYPAARVSHRVPFGTGRAQQEWLQNTKKRQYAYHPDTFRDLSKLMRHVKYFYEQEEDLSLQKLPSSLQGFLLTQDFAKQISEIKSNSSSFVTFSKRFFAWFSGFKALKFVHYFKDNYNQQIPLVKSSNWLLSEAGIPGSRDPAELLRIYRRLDKERQMIKITNILSA
jgi:glycosyltransferase involved in cell wall biosynthesis